ncbi:hypothetical protein BZG36_04348 [Bifiguratus adelaidae]|uniref:Alpha-1,2 mannosyltransferase KTR1 n=1 Tax=Bifiguratus adelaidae TaxID=1938954 RepID=A0A261XWT6_9FUNG|nr:hypothetical protein BZG36_04348 [Bifiguratus adelaidae]
MTSLYIFYHIYNGFSSSSAAVQPKTPVAPIKVENKYEYEPPETVYQPHHPEFSAAFVTFVRGDTGSLGRLRQTMRDLEDSFNSRIHYPYIILSDEDLSDEFKELTQAIAKTSTVLFGKVDNSTGYGIPSWIDQSKIDLNSLGKPELEFGNNFEARMESRFMSGFIFRHPLLKDLDWYWRIEAGSEYLCPIDFDPFVFMREHGKKLSFSTSLYEYEEKVQSIWPMTVEFAESYAGSSQITWGKKNSIGKFILSEDGGYNRCHFWSNFQLADLSYFRSPEYLQYFEMLDKNGGFFYERWGDPVVHTLAASLFLTKDQIHHFDEIGYRVPPQFLHCPVGNDAWKKCACRPEENFDHHPYSCAKFWADL